MTPAEAKKAVSYGMELGLISFPKKANVPIRQPIKEGKRIKVDVLKAVHLRDRRGLKWADIAVRLGVTERAAQSAVRVYRRKV